MYEGQEIEIGPNAQVKTGNVLPLGSIPEGVPIYNIARDPETGAST